MEQRQIKAYLGEPVRATRNDRGWTVAGYLVRYTDSQQRDLYREWFDAETDFMLDQGYDLNGMRVLFNHGMRPEVGVKAIGQIVTWREDAAGLFVEALIDEQDEYMQRVMEAMADGSLGLGWSSGALPQAVRVSDEGHVERWPIIEASLTHIPAMPFETKIALRGLIDVADLTGSANAFTVKANDTGAARIDHGQSEVASETNEQQQRGKIMDKEQLIEKLREIMDMLAIDDLSDEEAEEIAEAAYDEAVETVSVAEAAEDAERMDEDEAEKAFIAAAYRRLKGRRKKSNVRSIVEKLERESVPFRSGGSFSINRNVPHTPMRDLLLYAARMHEGSATRSSVRAQNPEIGTLGGYLLGQQLANEILPELRARVVAFDAGVRATQIEGVGAYVVPKMTNSPQAYRPGMNEEVTEDEAEFDVVIANPRPVAARVRIPRQQLLQSAVSVEQSIREQMIRSIALKIDVETFIGTGRATASDPGAQIMGIERVLQTNPAYASSNVVTLATNGRRPVMQDLEDAITALASANVEQNDTWGWVFHPRVEGVFRSLTDTTGQPLLRGHYGDREYERLLGYRKHLSTQIPVNRTTGTNNNTSLIFLGRFDFAQYVMSNQIEILVDEFTHSKNLQVQFTAYTFSDFIVEYPQAFYLINGVTF